MEPRKRMHLVNELMEEATLMMRALEKSLEAQRMLGEESHHATHDEPSFQGQSLQDEHASWEKVLHALTTAQTELDKIEQSEHHRIERLTPSA
jgi:hypothetical protein